MSTDKLIAILEAHGIEVDHLYTDNGFEGIRVLDEWTLDGVLGSEWTWIAPTLPAVRAWLGY